MLGDPNGYTQDYLAVVAQVTDAQLQKWIDEKKVNPPETQIGDSLRYDLAGILTAVKQIAELHSAPKTTPTVIASIDVKPAPVAVIEPETVPVVVEAKAESHAEAVAEVVPAPVIPVVEPVVEPATEPVVVEPPAP